MPKEDWDFANADIHYMSHGFHPYPARMIPQIAKELIRRYSSKEDIVLDPFCGSGGVLVEAMLSGRHSFGVDINPLACLLAKVKTTPIDPKVLMGQWESLRKELSRDIGALRFRQLKVKVPDFSNTNITYWFKPYMIEELALIKEHIDHIKDKDIREFFYVCFSHTIRNVSGTRKGEFKLYRMAKKEWDKYTPDVLAVLEEKVNNAISKMGQFFEFLKQNKINCRAEVFEADTSQILTEQFPPDAQKKLKEGSVNLIVTSPPYGDSPTTVAYGQFSRYSLIWLGYDKERVLEIDKKSLGGKLRDENLNSKTLYSTLQRISTGKRAEEVKSYFIDLNECLEKLSKVLAPRGHACLVLGNRTVNGIKIPTDQIITELGREFGFEQQATISRRIPSKRIPWKSSPTNVPGKKVETISRENIIVLRK